MNFCISDAYMPKKRGRGRPKRSRAQNCQESIHRNLSSHINPSNMVEVSPECEESEDAGMVASNILIIISLIFSFTSSPLSSIQL